MDWGVLLLVAMAAAGLAVVAMGLFARLRHGQADNAVAVMAASLAQSQASLDGRLRQLAEMQQTAQSQLGERLQAQERALRTALDERLALVGQSVGETLEKTRQQTDATMTDLRDRLVRIDAAQKQLGDLATQVGGLQELLSNKQARGAFGEAQLADLVTGVLPPDAYGFQVTLSNGKRVDCLLRLPMPPGPIAIDAKFPLESYRALRAATDDTARALAARGFSADVLTHVRDIRDRYILAGETADSALMFLPSEAIYAELHSNFASVIEQSYRARVFIVSPTTLWATLNTVRAVLKDVRMRQQADVIQTEVRILLEDVTRLDDRVGKLQRHFDQTADDLRQIRISTEKVVKRGERIEEIGLAEPEAPPAVAATAAVRLAGDGA